MPRKQKSTSVTNTSFADAQVSQAKYCPRCQLTLEVSNFYISKTGKIRSYCKSCTRELSKLNSQQVRQNAPERLRARAREWYSANRERMLVEGKEKRKQNPQKFKAWAKAWREKNPDRDREIQQKSVAKNRDRIRAYQREYSRNNKDKLRAQRNANPNLKISSVLRKYIVKKLRGSIKAAATIELLGCTIPEFRAHLEALFQPGMTWENYGLRGWHIDHILPCASFDLTDPAQQCQCFHYSNMQPLWAVDNLKKGASI